MPQPGNSYEQLLPIVPHAEELSLAVGSSAQRFSRLLAPFYPKKRLLREAPMEPEPLGLNSCWRSGVKDELPLL